MDCLKDQLYDGVVLAGRFETISPLNHGSFGMVFMANDLDTNQVVAIKCLTKKNVVTEADYTFAIDEDSEELKHHARLGNHPNIVNLITSFETEAHIYLVLEFCSRGDLYEAIRNGNGPLQTEHVRQFMLQLVNAVEYIHSKGLYHRDIKPENIFLTQSGVMKLGDFGLATTQKWSYEVTVGSDRYMAPEQFDSAGAGYAPEKADIWAIGICLLNILFSRNPFTAPTESDPLFLDFSRDMQSLFDVFPTMSQDTFEIIQQCMSLDPRKRTLKGVREALERLVSFATADEVYDDFLVAERRGIAHANREPLRTPSIQSPQNELSCFNWTKALQATLPSQMQRDSAQFEYDNFSEDLFPKSDEDNHDWFSDGQQSPSLKSVVESTYEPSPGSYITRSTPVIVEPSKNMSTFQSTSLPTFLGSTIGNKNDAISKSWSDLWEEDELEEAQNKIKARQLQNSRTWSSESKSDLRSNFAKINLEGSDYISAGLSKYQPDEGKKLAFDVDEVDDSLFIQEIDQVASSKPKSEEKSRLVTNKPPIDKWSALGERRRRAHTGPSVSEKDLRAILGSRDTRNLEQPLVASNNMVRHQKLNLSKESGYQKLVHGCPWSNVRSGNHINSNGKHLGNSGDLEWVGGWKETCV
ncbi:hypothetical protein Golomagni_00368 [Golovinomyces magnicellulatus]|nr:hypothetical protein Golomagni_00368 [Golovinomyces magnicellulatus]